MNIIYSPPYAAPFSLHFLSVLLIYYIFRKTLCPEKCFQTRLDTVVQWQRLYGWDIKIAGHDLNDNYKNTFRIENGVMKVSYDQYTTFDEKFGHIYYKEPFSYYIIRVEYRFTGNQLAGGAAWNVRNSGVMIHSQSGRSMPKAQDFPVSLEVQLLGGLGSGERHTGNLCTPGTIVEMNGKINPAHCIDSDSRTYHGDQWVTMEAIVLGDSLIHHVIEGDTVLTYENRKSAVALSAKITTG